MFRRCLTAVSPRVMTLFAAVMFACAGCDSGDKPKKEAGTSGAGTSGQKKEHHHAEHGPHKGTLVALGDEEAHLEFVLDAESGKLTAYVLDGEAENPIPVKHDKLVLQFTLEDHDHDHDADDDKDDDHKEKHGDKGSVPDASQLALKAVSPDANGMTAQFEGESDELKGAKEFHALVILIKVGDKEFPNVEFDFPEGNEHHHH